MHGVGYKENKGGMMSECPTCGQIQQQKWMVRQKQYPANVDVHSNHIRDLWRYCRSLYYATYIRNKPDAERCWRELPEWWRDDCTSLMVREYLSHAKEKNDGRINCQ